MASIGRSERAGDELVDETHAVRDLLRTTWWTFALRGVLALFLGLLFLGSPLRAISTVVLIFGAWALVDGAITLIAAITKRKSWELGVLGFIGVIAGYLILTRPTGAMMVFFVLAAAWIMARGATEIAIGVGLPRGTAGRGVLIAMGLIGFAFGMFMIAAPAMGVTVLGWWIALYALFEGVAALTLGFQVRRLKREIAAITPFTPHAVPT